MNTLKKGSKKIIIPLSCFQLAIFIFLLVPSLIVLPLNAQKMTAPFIFQPENHKKYIEDQTAIYQVMSKYYEAVEKANITYLEEVFHPSWFMRDTDMPREATLNVENKPTFIKRVRDHGPYLNYAKDRVFAKLDLAYEHFAYIRINKDPSRSSTNFFLYRLAGNWTIMDKLWVPTRPVYSDIPPAKGSYAAIESLVQTYYTAVATANQVKLNQLLHDKWDLKSVRNDGTLQTISKSEYLDALEKEKDFVDYTQLLSIDIFHDKLAIIRVDQPTEQVSSFLSVFKVNGNWMIVNERKAFAH